jgi:transcription elongation factor B subunit 1
MFAVTPRQQAQVANISIPSGVVLEKVVEYFHYWYRNRDAVDVPDMDIPVELCLELLMAANYFNLDPKPAMRDTA